MLLFISIFSNLWGLNLKLLIASAILLCSIFRVSPTAYATNELHINASLATFMFIFSLFILSLSALSFICSADSSPRYV